MMESNVNAGKNTIVGNNKYNMREKFNSCPTEVKACKTIVYLASTAAPLERADRKGCALTTCSSDGGDTRITERRVNIESRWRWRWHCKVNILNSYDICRICGRGSLPAGPAFWLIGIQIISFDAQCGRLLNVLRWSHTMPRNDERQVTRKAPTFVHDSEWHRITRMVVRSRSYRSLA